MKDILKQLLREELAFEGMVNEIDWDNTFSDVKKTCINPTEMVAYLNQVRANAPLKTKDREKFPKNKPYIHAKSRNFDLKSDSETVDVEHFIKQITSPPKNMITDYNEKIAKSKGPDEHVYSTGIPAFRGIVYSVKENKFYNVNTCPGAGSCVLICYAMKGRYIQYPASYDNMTKRLNYMLNYPDKFEEQLYSEIEKRCIEHKALEGRFDTVIIRWNDSGDFFAKKYTTIAESVINRLRKNGYNVQSYGYTKVADVANNSEIAPRMSSGANKQQTSQATTNKKATMIPKAIFKGLDFNTIDGSKEIKQRVAQHLNIDVNTVVTFRELMRIPEGDELKWNVIIAKDSGDNAAWRNDVADVLLLQH